MNFPVAVAALVLSATYAPMAIEDFRSREVSDVAIVLPYLNFILAFYILGVLSFLIIALVMITLALGWFLYRKGYIASGDFYSLPLLFSSFYAYPWPLIYVPVVFGAHMSYYFARNGLRLRRKRPREARDSSKYIPVEADGKEVKGVIDERYERTSSADEVVEEFGVPLAGYIALAGLLGVITDVILQAFFPSLQVTFLSLTAFI